MEGIPLGTISDNKNTTSHKIIRNTIYNTLGHLCGGLISLILTPYILHKIGNDLFGIWVVLAVAINYFGLFDLGIGMGFIPFIGDAYTRKDFRRVNEVVITGNIFYILFGLLVLITGLLLERRILNLLNISPEIYDEIHVVYIGILTIAIIRGVFMVYRSVLYSIQRMDTLSNIAIAIAVFNAIGIIYFLEMGYGLKGLVVNGIIIAILNVGAETLWAYKGIPEMRFDMSYFRKDVFKELFTYGTKLQVAKFSELINTQVDKLFLSHFINVGAVTFYELGAKLSQIINSIPSLLLPVVTPAASELKALKDKENLRQLYKRGTKYITFLTIPLMLFGIVFAEEIISFWIGRPGYERAALALRVLILGYAAFILTNVGKLILRGTGEPQYEMRSSLLTSIINILVSIILIIKIGFTGALIGTASSMIIGSFYFMFLFHKHQRELLSAIIRDIYLVPSVSAILASVSILILHIFISPELFPEGRAGYALSLTINGFLFGFIYLFVILKTGFMDRYDIEIFSDTYQMARGFIIRR